jgi:hypothetical protein
MIGLTPTLATTAGIRIVVADKKTKWRKSRRIRKIEKDAFKQGTQRNNKRTIHKKNPSSL